MDEIAQAYRDLIWGNRMRVPRMGLSIQDALMEFNQLLQDVYTFEPTPLHQDLCPCIVVDSVNLISANWDSYPYVIQNAYQVELVAYLVEGQPGGDDARAIRRFAKAVKFLLEDAVTQRILLPSEPGCDPEIAMNYVMYFGGFNASNPPVKAITVDYKEVGEGSYLRMAQLSSVCYTMTSIGVGN